MSIEALEEAVSLWQDAEKVAAMLDEWEGDPRKEEYEHKTAEWAGKVKQVADVGCGNGRYAVVLDYDKYSGFDGSTYMIGTAKEQHGNIPTAEFSVADVFRFSPSEHYDLVIMMDVTQHQNMPLEAAIKMLQLWSADRYIFSVLVGDKREDLLMTTIVPFSGLLRLLDRIHYIRFHIDRYINEEFGRVQIECTGLK